MVISFLFYFALIPRYIEKRAAAKDAQAKVDAVVAASAESADGRKGSVSSAGLSATNRCSTGALFLTVDEREDIERTFAALSILRLCCIIWTVFVVTYCVVALESWLFGEKCVFAPSWHFAVDCILDLCAKMIFTSIIVD
jgi:hypothetical protein